MKKGDVEIDNDAIKQMIDGYAREAGVRSLENNIKKIMRKADKEVSPRGIPSR